MFVERFDVWGPLVDSVERVIDDTGTTVAHYQYDASGAPRSTTGSLTQPYRYTGERLDTPTATYHLRAREYDPSLGVFTSPDPVERSMSQPFSGSYNYVDGMPTQFTDPMGTCLGSGYVSCGDMLKGYGSVLASTPAVAYENYQGVTQGIADKVADTAVGFGTMCLNGMSNHTWSTVAGPIGNCAAGAGEELGGAAASVYNSCNTTARHHDAMGTAQCYGNGAWSETQRYVSECMGSLAISGYAAGNGCVGDLSVIAAAGAAGRLTRGGGDGDSSPASIGSCSPMHSFAGETLVLMGDHSWRPIQEVRVGDVVWATDPITGKSSRRTVSRTLPHADDAPFVRIHAAGGSVVATENHPVWNETIGRWQAAGTLGPAARLRSLHGTLHTTRISTASPTDGRVVYDLTVEEIHSYHVKIGNAAVLVHNSDCDPGRGLHGDLAAAGRGIDANDVIGNADNVYVQVMRNGDERFVYTMQKADGSYDVVIRNPSAPPGENIHVVNRPASEVQKKLSEGTWSDPMSQ